MGTAQGGFGCGIRMALIRYCTPRAGNRCKRCGHGARIFCTYLQRAGCNSELMRDKSRGANNSPDARPRAPRARLSEPPTRVPSCSQGKWSWGFGPVTRNVCVCSSGTLVEDSKSPVHFPWLCIHCHIDPHASVASALCRWHADVGHWPVSVAKGN